VARPPFDPEADALDWLDASDLAYERERGMPYVEIEPSRGDQRFGWWRIRVHHGVIVWGPDGGPFWRFGSRAFAERCASSVLMKYWRYLERHEVESIEIRP
jgi:hypothetical protein